MNLKSFGFREHFEQLYKGTIQDPLLDALLQALDQYSTDLYNKFLLESYAQKKEGIDDGYYEILRQNLLGPLFPGPVYSVAEATAKSAQAITLDEASLFEYHTDKPETVNFTPCNETLVVPARSNEVAAFEKEGDLWLGFSIAVEQLKDSAGRLLLFVKSGNIELLSKLRCFPWAPDGEERKATSLSSFHVSSGEEQDPDNSYPGEVNLFDRFRKSPFEYEFLQIPIEILKKCTASNPFQQQEDALWIKIKSLGELSEALQGNLRINCFPIWNMFRSDDIDAKHHKNLSYKLDLQKGIDCEILIHSVRDQGGDESVEYSDCKRVLDPAYPYQYEFFRHHIDQTGEIRLSKKAKGSLRVEFDMYDKREDFVGLKPARLEIKGLQESLSTVTTVEATKRLAIAEDGKVVWDYFRSSLNSRSRWLSQADLRHAIKSFPPLSPIGVNDTQIQFQRKIGRIYDCLTPYTEITVPVQDVDKLQKGELKYFENTLCEYLMGRTVSGQFLKVRIV